MKFRDIFRHAAMTAACTAALSVAGTASGANWLMLQGTEAPGASPPAKVWGWIQANYQKDYSKPNAAGQYVPPKLLGPDLNSQSGFNIQRARIGVRGTAFPIDDGHVNYFIMAEFGNNPATHASGAEYTFGKLTDASITLNYLPGARVRAGLFKYPGAEEGMQGIPAMDYIDFTEVTNGLLLERFPNHVYTANLAPQTLAQLQTTSAGTGLNGFSAPIGAFRDVGVQLFDAFELPNDWELSYAAMLGQGSGIEFDNVDGKYDTYLYLSLEKKFGTGKGPFAEGLKFFAWSQNGQRLLDNTNDATNNPVLYKRDRSGVGVKYLQKPFRVTAEYIKADGMIWVGPDKPSFTFAASNGADAQANGYYVEGGWYIPSTKWELDARYDTMDRLLNRPDEHRFTKDTLGVQYHFTARDKVTVDYEFRQFKCIASTTACTNVNKNLSGVGNKLGIQLTTIF